MLTEFTDYRKYLKGELADRCARNPSYSLRSFAKQIGISASHLSRVINEEKDVSPNTAIKVTAALNLSESETEHFLDLVSLATADHHMKNLLLERIASRSNRSVKKTLEAEMFRVISDWYCLPLFELIKTRGFEGSVAWISARLGISSAEVKVALDRLESVGLISTDSLGVITATAQAEIQTSDDIPDAAIKKHHEQMSQKAIECIRQQPVEAREFQSIHFAFDLKNIKKAKKMIRAFAEQFEAEFRPLPGEDIYQLNLQFFSLTKQKPKKPGGRK